MTLPPSLQERLSGSEEWVVGSRPSCLRSDHSARNISFPKTKLRVWLSGSESREWRMSSGKSMQSRRSWERLDGVDLLRGLAIFPVLMNHVNMRLLSADVPCANGIPAQIVSSLVWNGQRGVQIFFAVSGFLITSTTLRRWGMLKAVSVRDFYLLRIARIAPLLLLLLVILSTLHAAGLEDFVVSAKT